MSDARAEARVLDRCAAVVLNVASLEGVHYRSGSLLVRHIEGVERALGLVDAYRAQGRAQRREILRHARVLAVAVHVIEEAER